MLISTNVNLWQPRSPTAAPFSKAGRFCYQPETAGAAMTWSSDWPNMDPSTGGEVVQGEAKRFSLNYWDGSLRPGWLI